MNGQLTLLPESTRATPSMPLRTALEQVAEAWTTRREQPSRVVELANSAGYRIDAS